VACHGDLTRANLFVDGEQVWVVDYRWAGAGDPYEDLGSIATHLDLDDERCDALIGLYFGRIDEAARSRLALMRLAARYVAAMRELARPPTSSAIDEGAAERHLVRMLEGFDDDRFDRWLSSVT
ncbi:MAG: phosphotransferase, partial [Actinomycetota bacterium]|nr:phosphotransferase [Actinomycetota bacterium]